MRGGSVRARLLLLVAGLAAGLAACRTADTTEAPLPDPKPPAYAMAGGNAVPKRLQAMQDRGLAPISGNEAGFYMDGVEEELLATLKRQGISVTRVGPSLILNMEGRLAFAPNSAELAPALTDALRDVAAVVRSHDRLLVDVTGHSDRSGKAEANRKLSEDRARAVADFLIAEGAEGERFILRGAGAREPIASNGTAEGRAQNRRVEIRLAPFATADQRTSYRQSVAP